LSIIKKLFRGEERGGGAAQKPLKGLKLSNG